MIQTAFLSCGNCRNCSVRRLLTFGLMSVACSIASGAEAADTNERIGIAYVSMSDGCPKADARASVVSERDIVVSGSVSFAPILGGFVGSVAGAALNALGTALEDAAKSSTVGGEGRLNFEYYGIDTRLGRLAPLIGSGDFSCLVVSLPQKLQPFDMAGTVARLPADYVVEHGVISRRDRRELTAAEEASLNALLDPSPSAALYLEARLTSLHDGFTVEPVYVEYRSPLPTLSRSRRLAAELQITLAGPIAVKDGAGSDTVYGVNRIKLPPLAPGDVWWQEQLNVRGGLLPHRPIDASAADLRAGLVPYTSNRDAARAQSAERLKLIGALGLVRNRDGDFACGPFESACAAVLKAHKRELGTESDLDDDGKVAAIIGWALAAGSPFDDDRRKVIREAVASYRDKRVAAMVAKEATVGLASRSGDNAAQDTVKAGSVSLLARVVLITDEKKFLKIIGQALTGQADPMKTAVTGRITGALTSQPAWNADQSAFAVAMASVTEQETTLATAQAGGDAAIIAAAKTEFVRRKAAANEKAAAIGAPIPYPVP